jgi:uncharacterized protein
MKNLVIVSDTHGSFRNIKKCISGFDNLKPEYVVHLGDDYVDADIISQFGYKVVRVPGLWTDYYQNPSIDNKMFWDFEGWRFFLTHSIEPHYNDLKGDISSEKVIKKKQCDVFLFGHTHIPKVVQQDGIVFVNPGHLKEKETRSKPSYAFLQVSKSELKIAIVPLGLDPLKVEFQIVQKTPKKPH